MPLETATVLTHKTLAGDYRVIKFFSQKIAPQVRPGQFVHVRVTARNDYVLRRPFSVFMAGRCSLAILYKVVGKGTEIMAGLRPGDKLSMLGPLGNGFPAPPSENFPLFVAGGYGSAALYLLAERIKQKGVLLIGGKTGKDILCAADFKKIGWQVRVATEDGSAGQKGFVTDLLMKWMGSAGGRAAALVRPPISGGTRLSRPANLEIYACGPMGMLKAVSEIAVKGGWQAWLSLDRHMGCGVGSCLACVQQVKDGSGGWKWARICTEGPVFECREIVWD